MKQQVTVKLGFALLEPESDPARFSSWVKLARRIRVTGHQCIGLLPASESVGVPAPSVQLALALNYLHALPVCVVDLNTRTPGWREHVPSAALVKGVQFVSVPIRERVWVRTPLGRSVSRFDKAPVQREVAVLKHQAAHVLCDMTGFQREVDVASSLVDAVAVVSYAGKQTEQQISRAFHSVPAEQRLGVVLVDDHFASVR